jgi:hypothetical protein
MTDSYFIPKIIYFSKKTGETSFSLTDFKNNHKLGSNVIDFYKKVEENITTEDLFKTRINGLSFKIESLNKVQWVEDVEILNSSETLNLTPFDDYDFYKQQLVEVLSESLLQYKNQKNLLLLSGGVDSQLLLDIFLKNSIPVNCIHVTYDVLDSIESKWLFDHQSRFKYPLEFELTGKLGKEYIKSIMTSYSKINPADFTANLDLIYASILSLDKYKEFDNVFSGLYSERVLIQRQVDYLNETIKDKNLIYEFDKKYGSYVSYSDEISSFKRYEDHFGKNYVEFSSKEEASQYPVVVLFLDEMNSAPPATQKILRSTPRRKRNNYSIEAVSNKKMIFPYANKKLHELALSLRGEAAIKNAYKMPQIEILGKQSVFKKTRLSTTFNFFKGTGLEQNISNECLKIWINNYLGLPLDTDPKTISLS